MNSKHIVKVTADDYGYCSQRNKGILEVLNNGIINSVSVLINGFVIDAFQLPPQRDVKIGLHLNLTEGLSITDATLIPSLLDSNGLFFPKYEFQEKIPYFSKEELCKEITNQILKFETAFGVLPDYIDGHQHCHILQVVRDSLVKCMNEFNIKDTRIPYELCIDQVEWINGAQKTFFQSVLENCLMAKELFCQNGIRFPKYFIGLSTMSRNLTFEKLKRALEIVKEDFKEKQDDETDTEHLPILEIMTHPGYCSTSDQAGCGAGPDDFAKSNDREYEMHMLCLDDFLNLEKQIQNIFVKSSC